MNAGDPADAGERADGAAAAEATPPPEPEPEPHPARELSAHLLRMLETRMEAAGIALRGETQLVISRLQLKLLAGAAVFFAVWGGIVLLAIALPEHLRVPVLGAAVAGFVLLALVAWIMGRKKAMAGQVGSMRWFLDSLRQDLELLSRALTRQATHHKPSNDRSPPHDLAA